MTASSPPRFGRQPTQSESRGQSRPGAGPAGPWQVEIIVPRPALAVFERVLAAADSLSTMADGDEAWRIRAIFREPPPAPALEASLAIAAAAAALPSLRFSVEPLAERDWVAEGLSHLGPVAVGRFHVRGSHSPPAGTGGAIDLVVNAGRAFGSGHHATTAGCLLLLGELARRRRFRRPLDLGCGAGVLALAMARLWPAAVLAVDIDPIAVSVARANAALNRLSPRVRTALAGGFFSRTVRTATPFDLIAANILAGPLTAMARPLARALAPDGVVVLSGILVAQERAVINAYRRAGLRLLRRVTRDDWVTLLAAKRPAHPRGP